LINILVKLKEDPGEKVLGLFDGCDVVCAVAGKAPPLKVAGENTPYDIILLEGNGLDTLRSIKDADPRAEVVIIGKATAKAVESVREGASAYFERPLEMKAFKNTVEHILDLIRLRQETGKLENILSSKYTFYGIVGKNPAILEIKNFIRRIAPYCKAITIGGEAGAGKELVARALHDMSQYSEESFVVYDCAATTEQTLERELFGAGDLPGLFVEAGHGTIVLDNIEYLPISAHEPLLGIVRHGELVRNGSGKRISVNCRVAALTEMDLTGNDLRAALGEDLYTSLTELNLHVPPLRDRKDDMPLLIRYFLRNFSERTGKRISGASMPVQTLFMKYDWPGNVTELENLIERVAADTNETFIGFDDLPPRFAKLAEEDSLRSLSLEDAIKSHVRMVYDLSRQDLDEAADRLGIRSAALKKKLESYSLL